MKKYRNQQSFASVIMALLYIGLGIFLFIRSKEAGAIICYGLGLVLLTAGIVEIILGFHRRAMGMFYVINMIIGVILLSVGIMMVINPDLFQMLLSWMFGALLIISGISNLLYAGELREYGYASWWTTGLFSVVKLVGAIILFTHTVGQLLFMIAGVLLVLGGVTDLISMIMLKVASKNVTTDETDIVIDAKEGRDFRDADPK